MKHKRILVLTLLFLYLVSLASFPAQAARRVFDYVFEEYVYHQAEGSFRMVGEAVYAENRNHENVAFMVDQGIGYKQNALVRLQGRLLDGAAFGIFLTENNSAGHLFDNWTCLNVDHFRQSSRYFSRGNSNYANAVGDAREKEVYVPVEFDRDYVLELYFQADGKVHSVLDGNLLQSYDIPTFSMLYVGFLTYQANAEIQSLELILDPMRDEFLNPAIYDYFAEEPEEPLPTEQPPLDEEDFEPDYPENEPIDFIHITETNPIQKVLNNAKFNYSSGRIEYNSNGFGAAMTGYTLKRGLDVNFSTKVQVDKGSLAGFIFTENSNESIDEGYIVFYINWKNNRAYLLAKGGKSAQTIAKQSMVLPKGLQAQYRKNLIIEVSYSDGEGLSFGVDSYDIFKTPIFNDMPTLYMGYFSQNSKGHFEDSYLTIFEYSDAYPMP